LVDSDQRIKQLWVMMTPSGSPSRSRGLTIETVHWHILREDQHRAGVATRATAVLSTNALIVAGTALSFAARGSQRPNLATLVSASATLLVVAASVIFASLALIAPRVWPPRWNAIDGHALSDVYSYGYYSLNWSTFEEFRESIVNLSPDQQLRGAIIELWKAAYIHQIRYRKLRSATRCLPVAIGFLLVTIALTMVAF
jgi:hypothetical protein